MSTCMVRHRLLGDSLRLTWVGIYPSWVFGVMLAMKDANQAPVSSPTK